MEHRKYRVWDGQNMVYNIGIHPTITMIHKNYEYPERGCMTVSPEMKAYIIMQCTGHIDKNKILIYEGDVYREEREHDHGDYTNYYICTWIKELACFSWLNNGQYNDYEDNGFKCIEYLLNDGFPMHMDFEDNADIKIIGNIYERPELLTL